MDHRNKQLVLSSIAYWQYSLVRIEAAVKQIAAYCITAYGVSHYKAHSLPKSHIFI